MALYTVTPKFLRLTYVEKTPFGAVRSGQMRVGRMGGRERVRGGEGERRESD